MFCPVSFLIIFLDLSSIVGFFPLKCIC